jgi:glycosyltransferase involved in cell wall biosynthesis
MFKPLPDQPDFEIIGEQPPQASLFMPSHDREKFVQAALRSALDQSGIVLEILLLDDVSQDHTPKIILQTLQQHTDHPHTVKFWKGRTPRGNNVTATLVDKASCDFCIAQHDDDISAPHRAQRLLAVHLETGATVLSSEVNVISENKQDAHLDKKSHPNGFISSLDLIRAYELNIIGATFAFNRRELRKFPRLDTSYLNFPQDRLIAFRGSLLSGFYQLPDRLLNYRKHEGQWSARIINYQTASSMNFSYLGLRLTFSQAMERDLDHLLSSPPLRSSIDIENLRTETHALREPLLLKYIAQREDLIRHGFRELWVKESVYDQLQLEYYRARFWTRGRWRIWAVWLRALSNLFRRDSG